MEKQREDPALQRNFETESATSVDRIKALLSFLVAFALTPPNRFMVMNNPPGALPEVPRSQLPFVPPNVGDSIDPTNENIGPRQAAARPTDRLTARSQSFRTR